MKRFAFISTALFLLITFFGCSKDLELNSTRDKLVGTWYKEKASARPNEVTRVQYDFREDSSFEIVRVERNMDTGEVLGYRYRRIGKYGVADDKLTFSHFATYNNVDSIAPYASIENLRLVEGDSIEYHVTCTFEEQDNKLIFTYPPCGPFTMCITSDTLTRAK